MQINKQLYSYSFDQIIMNLFFYNRIKIRIKSPSDNFNESTHMNEKIIKKMFASMTTLIIINSIYSLLIAISLIFYFFFYYTIT